MGKVINLSAAVVFMFISIVSKLNNTVLYCYLSLQHIYQILDEK